jgi:hypothetical protein
MYLLGVGVKIAEIVKDKAEELGQCKNQKRT